MSPIHSPIENVVAWQHLAAENPPDKFFSEGLVELAS